MKKVIFITGAQGTGKTTKAKEITEGLKTVTIFPGYKNKFYFHTAKIESDTEAIIIEGVTNLDEILGVLAGNGLTIDTQSVESFYYEFKLIVITSQVLTEKDFPNRRDFTFIQL